VVINNKIEPFLMSVLSSRINSIARQMTYTYQRSARSSVMSSARDLSTAICDANGDVIALPNGFPVHCAGIGLTPKAVMQFHPKETMQEGDAYLHNSPYHGNTHPADHTLVVPVFWDDELIFFCVCRGHQADIGNHVPTTYDTYARDVYEEGALIFPGVQVQRNYQDVADIINMCRMRIRVPDQWYGDFLAGIGAARIGERSLKEMLAKYGKETLKTFCQEWHEYGSRRMVEEIKKLPAGTSHYETKFDPIPGLIPDGITVGVKLTIDPEAATITADFTENADSQPCGLNLCQATLTAGARAGVLGHLSPDLPLCEGAMNHIIVKMREGSVVGKAKHPFSSSVATTHVNNRAVQATQCAFNVFGEKLAMAEGALEHPPAMAVISGFDTRYQRQYVTQLMSGMSGGMGVYGHDGYIPYCPSNAGMMEWNSMEIVEQKYPVIYLEQQVITDSAGAGKWDGAPACRTVIATRDDPVTFVFIADGKFNPPRGALEGQDGRATWAGMRDLNHAESNEIELPQTQLFELQPNQALISEVCAGGGVFDPLERDPEMVRRRAREGWISLEKARSVYGVVLDTKPELFAVDYPATEALRAEIMEKRRK
jgi:N-methylhydantoinase B